MSITTRSRLLSFVLVAAAASACTSDDGTSPPTSSTSTELDVIGLAERPATLLVLSPTATVAERQRLERVLVRLGGAVLESHPPRLVIAQVPAGADAVLTALGVVARFDRAATAADLAAATVLEERFLAVHAARWFPVEVPADERVQPRFLRRADGEVEAAPQRLPQGALEAAALDPEDAQPVPFASGTVVVSIVLPESNGAIDRSTEDWTEAQIRETYLKVQTALDRIAAAEPNADLRFVLHYESAPAAGGLPGTVDTDYEFGQRAQWGSSDEPLATADVLSSILGRTVTVDDLWSASLEYDADLKRRYGADGAFFVIVAGNGNYTAGLRAHAWIGGPHTVLDSSYSHEVFAHEFGHIFGAHDEYCPDACAPPTSIAGYLGMYNANAQYQVGGPGIDEGKGEAAPSLMIWNDPSAINGYTRGAWGWLDSDGDGVIEVRDTAPRSALTATVSGNRVRVAGTITDRGDSRTFGNVRYSANRITALEYGFAAAGPWFRVALPADTRGRQAVDVELGAVPAGTRTIWVRGVNSVGNVEGAPLALRVTTTGTGNAAPHLRLDVPARAGTAAPVTIATTTLDLDGDAVQVRYDLDGNGSWDTGYRAAGAHSFTPTAGLRTIRAQARDARGATRTVTAGLPVVSGAAAPTLALTDVPSLIHGVSPGEASLTATAPGATLSVITELATSDDPYRVAGALGADGRVAAVLPTPTSLRTRGLDLSAGDLSLARAWFRDLVVLDADHVAVAAGSSGLWILDVTDRGAARVVSHLVLETSANRLYRSGNRLYVLGTYLTIVDISDLASPREWKQLDSVTATVASTSEEAQDIPEAQGWGVTQFHTVDHGARVTAARVQVTIDHPAPADLVIRLLPDKGSGLEPIVLRDHVGGEGGLRTFAFSSATTPALRAINGQFADAYWNIEVTDDVGNGLTGRLVSSRLELRTRARAVPVIAGATEIAGLTAFGDLVVAGAGVEVLDVVFPQWVTSLSRVSGTATQTATMVGDTVVVAMPLEAKNPDGPPPTLRGLCAVDLRNPFWPRVVRCETALGGNLGEHAQVAGRLYVAVQPDCHKEEGCSAEPFTIVGDAARFARGWRWQHGTTGHRVDRWAFGDARSLWTTNMMGYVTELDVTSPTAVAARRTYARTYAARIVPLARPEVLLFDYSAQARVATLGDDQHILSRVYRITVEARGDGGVTRASRTVHVIPYDHAPSVVAASIVGKDGIYRVRIEARDGDGGASWDPTLFGRVDFDADGSWDTDWAYLGNDGTGLWNGEVELTGVPAGDYPAAVIEVRDGFWARGRMTVALTVP